MIRLDRQRRKGQGVNAYIRAGTDPIVHRETKLVSQSTRNQYRTSREDIDTYLREWGVVDTNVRYDQ